MATDKNPYSATNNLRLKKGIIRFDKQYSSNPIPVGYNGIYTDSNGDIIVVKNGVAAKLSTALEVMATLGTVATTGNTDQYIIAPKSGTLTAVEISSLAALAANDSNYLTFSITNLGQSGAGSAALLAATDANTTKATGGSGLSANTKRTLALSGTSADLVVVAGDRLRIRAAATGTLAGAVTFFNALLRFTVSA